MLRFIDSFDDRNTAYLGKKYFSTTGSITTGGRRGTNGVNGGVKLTLSDQPDEVVIGFAAKVSSFDFNIIEIYDSSNRLQFYVKLTALGALNFYYRTNNAGDFNGFATASFTVSSGIYYYYELKLKVKTDATGSLTMRMNGNPVYSTTDQQTAYHQNGAYGIQLFEKAFSTGHIIADDLYICDTTGTRNNTFLGDSTVECLLPDADGTYLEWTPSTGVTHYTLVDEVPPDENTSYIYTTTSGNRDTFSYSDLTTLSGIVAGVQFNIFANKGTPGLVSITPLAVVSSGLYEGDTVYVSDTYTYYMSIMETNPSTSGTWSLSDIDGSEFGVKYVG